MTIYRNLLRFDVDFEDSIVIELDIRCERVFATDVSSAARHGVLVTPEGDNVLGFDILVDSSEFSDDGTQSVSIDDFQFDVEQSIAKVHVAEGERETGLSSRKGDVRTPGDYRILQSLWSVRLIRELHNDIIEVERVEQVLPVDVEDLGLIILTSHFEGGQSLSGEFLLDEM